MSAVLAFFAVRRPNRPHFIPVSGLAAAATFLVFVALSAPAGAQAMEVPRQSAPVTSRAPASAAPAMLDVYEASHCTYCQSFREDYLPLLVAEYKDRLEIRFHEAQAAGWVQRTPTFVLGGKLLFEGLPYRYQDLATALDAELAAPHR